MNKKQAKIIAIGAVGLTAAAAAGYTILSNRKSIPDGAVAVTGFNIDRYLGKWYEIARLDFRFEKNMNHTTAEYSLNEDGTVQVVNRGFNYKKEQVGKSNWQS